MKYLTSISSALILASSGVRAIDLNPDDHASIKNAAGVAASGMMQWYTGYKPGDVPGNLPAPYYWWEAGAMFNGLMDYYMYTGDSQYNDKITQAMLHQVGPNDDYMPPNQTKTLGNDDQAFWGMAAMAAAENKFPDPPADQPQWLALAQAVFNTQANRWDPQCGGGLKWQIFTFNNGYNYKNTISNGAFFNMASRLARYTGNNTYLDWAEKAWDWVSAIGLMSPDYHFFDGSDDSQNCTLINHIQWTYNAGVFLHGAANLWNYTSDPKWQTRVQGILTNANVFFSPTAKNVMYEVACEPNGRCNNDQRSFKAYLSRWMTHSTQLAPFIHDQVMTLIRASAVAAAAQCNGGANQQTCGLKWTTNGICDGSFGPGEQMAAMEVIQSLLIDTVPGPANFKTGTSKGDPSAGSHSSDNPDQLAPINTGDKAGAGILTFLVLGALIGGAYFLII